MKLKFRSKGKNKKITIICPRHKPFAQPTYDLLDDKGEPRGVICWKCGRNMPVTKGDSKKTHIIGLKPKTDATSKPQCD